MEAAATASPAVPVCYRNRSDAIRFSRLCLEWVCYICTVKPAAALPANRCKYMSDGKEPIRPFYARIIRYAASIAMLTGMVAAAEITGDSEILFPEMAALTIGMWIVDKRVWRVTRPGLVALMTLGAVAGVCIVRYSPFPLLVNIALAFAFPALCLMASRMTMVPQISACMLPVLLQTRSWVYPAAVLVMSLLIVIGQRILVRCGLRRETTYEAAPVNLRGEALRWLLMLCTVIGVAAIPVSMGNVYFILPPLIVTYVELSDSKAGFRSRPLQVFAFMVASAALGSLGTYFGHYVLGLPKCIVAVPILGCLFALFERQGKYFAPAGATALVPMILPAEDLLLFPVQVAAGAAVFIAVSMLLFQRCYRWSVAQLAVAFVPVRIRKLRKGGRSQGEA